MNNTLQLCLTGLRPIQPVSSASRVPHDSAAVAAAAAVAVVVEKKAEKIRARPKPPPP